MLTILVESSLDGVKFRKLNGLPSKGYIFRDGADIEDIVVQGLGTVKTGEVAVVFNPGIGAEPFKLHIRKNKRTITISFNPYSGRVKITEGYV